MSEFDNRSPEDVEYGLSLPYHLTEAAKEEVAMADDLCELLTEFDFLEHKISNTLPQLLIEDYDLAFQPHILIVENTKNELKLLQSFFRLSSDILAVYKTQLVEQLWGRMQNFATPKITEILTQAKQSKTAWLCPLIPSLTHPGGNLIRTITGHTSFIWAVATIPNSHQAISGSIDGIIKIWNLDTGEEVFTFNAHSDAIKSLAVTSDAKRAVSYSSYKTL